MMPDTPVSRAEHEEFSRRMETENKRLADENDRQNARLAILEDTVRQNTAMVANVERLAVNMENMLKVQETQGKRLELLESRDGKTWRNIKGTIITSILSTLCGGLMGALLTTIIK